LLQTNITVSKAIRWVNNLGLVFFNTLVLRILFPAAAVGVAAFAQVHGWSMLNYYELPMLFSIVIAVVAMDSVIYLQHVMVHAVPLLWRIHRVHHVDLDYDVTTGARFYTNGLLMMFLPTALLKIFISPLIRLKENLLANNAYNVMKH
jgi:sterol desaturase/sphingolipid hydroxylase (fatty acid hydroxylase superfamily)